MLHSVTNDYNGSIHRVESIFIRMETTAGWGGLMTIFSSFVEELYSLVLYYTE